MVIDDPTFNREHILQRARWDISLLKLAIIW